MAVLPKAVYWRSRCGTRSRQRKTWLPAELGSLVRAHRQHSRLVQTVVELGVDGETGPTGARALGQPTCATKPVYPVENDPS
ncbi:MAG: hypothetical protein CM1200mP2_04470 [Planctomycetaceae bacterium]|nr:MAG: hypothetical protein CM1200mP2_04470 [Planctomycetaceae bacterium]